MLSLMSTQRAVIQAVQTSRVQQERLHTEDPARFYRHRWLRDGVPLTGYEARTLDDLFTEDKDRRVLGGSPRDRRAVCERTVSARQRQSACALAAPDERADRARA